MLEVVSLEDARAIVNARFETMKAHVEQSEAPEHEDTELGKQHAVPKKRASAAEALEEAARHVEVVPLAGAAGRTIAHDVVAQEGVPAFDRSTVDGFAVVAADTFGCSDALPALLELAGEIEMGTAPARACEPGACLRIPTGGQVPEGADAVVMLEYCEEYGDGTIGVARPVAPGENIVFENDDVKPGEILIAAGTCLLPHHIGTLASLGMVTCEVEGAEGAEGAKGSDSAEGSDGANDQCAVEAAEQPSAAERAEAPIRPSAPTETKAASETTETAAACEPAMQSAAALTPEQPPQRPRVAIISTGDEIVPVEAQPVAAQMRDVNAPMLAAAVAARDAEPVRFPIVPDNYDALFATVSEALATCDVVLVSGGSSAGQKDNTARVLSALGEMLFHGVAVKPGKPTMCADVVGKPAFGLPGHPVAAYFMFLELVAPLLGRASGNASEHMCGSVQQRVGGEADTETGAGVGAGAESKTESNTEVNTEADAVEATLTAGIPSNHGRAELVAVRLEQSDDAQTPAASATLAVPIRNKSGLISQLSQADGYIEIPRNQEGLAAGASVRVRPF